MTKSIIDHKIDPNDLKKLNKYIVQDGFHEKLKNIGNLNLYIKQNPTISGIDIAENYYDKGANFRILDGLSKEKLNPSKGSDFSTRTVFSGYDESKLQFEALEGTANITSHSLVSVVHGEYYPISLITIYFYTRSKELVKKSRSIKYSENIGADSNRGYAIDRNQFILEHSLQNTILFIDGPLIGGNLSSYTLNLVSKLHDRNIIPIFVVKNSDSNLIINHVEEIKRQYNSDLHWAFRFLNTGERTNFFRYKDSVNPRNKKIFCYVKPFRKSSPQRVELHPDTYSIYKDYIDDIFNLIFYLVLVEGDGSNPQMRPIAIAEKYAREIIKTVNTRTIFRHTSLIPTMNQSRFGV